MSFPSLWLTLIKGFSRMENLVLRPKGAKKVSKIKKEVAQFRESHVVAPSTSLEPHERSLDEAVVNLLKKLKM